MAYSSDSFRDFAMETEGETSAVVVTDPVGIRGIQNWADVGVPID